MTLHTVSTGENLWKICKNKFKLTNNTDIANKVNEIAKKNNIKNPDMIFAGQKLDLSVGDTLVKSKEVQETAETKTKAVTSNPITQDQQKQYSQEITQAVEQKQKSWDFSSYQGFLDSLNSKVSIFGTNTKTEEQQKQAYNDYSEKLLLDHYDLNKDGTVTAEEFAKAEEQGNLKTNEIARKYDEQTFGLKASASDIENDNRIANRTANLFAKNLDMNGDGTISKEEFAFFNETADAIDGKKDGVISAASESAMFQSVTGMNADNKEINAVVNKYLLGETLTAEEQKILDNSSIKIRSAMSKAAGFTTEEQ